MRIGSFFKFYVLLVSFLFIFFSAYDLGLKREIFLLISATFLSPYIFKETIKVRGVRKGDTVLVSFKKHGPFGDFVQKIPARALSSGRCGAVIDVEYDRTLAKGEISSYGGLVFPPDVNLLYYEEADLKVIR
ncbi:MAG: hypothetical protein V3R86_06840 [Candidatus Hydrothermarchaeaceae archaeon]